MRCINCGTELADNAKFCGICGTMQPENDKTVAMPFTAAQIPFPAESEPIEPEPIEPELINTGYDNEPSFMPEQPSEPAPRAKRGHGLVIFLSILLAAVIGASAWLWFTLDSDDDDDDDSSSKGSSSSVSDSSSEDDDDSSAGGGDDSSEEGTTTTVTTEAPAETTAPPETTTTTTTTTSEPATTTSEPEILTPPDTQATTTTTQPETPPTHSGDKHITEAFPELSEIFGKTPEEAQAILEDVTGVTFEYAAEEEYDGGKSYQRFFFSETDSSSVPFLGTDFLYAFVEYGEDNKVFRTGFHYSSDVDIGQGKTIERRMSDCRDRYDSLYDQVLGYIGKEDDQYSMEEYGAEWYTWYGTEVGEIWLCTGEDLWGISGFNDTILSFTDSAYETQ